jgi:glutamine synthetase
MLHVDAHAMEAAQAELTEQNIDVVRLAYSDLIGAERGRDLLVRHLARTAGDGVAFCRSIYGTSPMGDVVDIDGGLSAGLPDMLAVPDLSTIRPVPWEPGVVHVLADVYNPDGSRSEESPRNVLRRVIDRFATLDMKPMIGPELEFYVMEPDPAAPNGWKRYGEATGNVYVAGRKGDPENTLRAALRLLE